MAYDQEAAQRVREIIAKQPGYVEKKMFGGIGFMLHGNMACSILNDDLIVRVGLEGYQDALNLPHTRIFDITGRVMKGWVMVASKGYASDSDLSAWIGRGVEFARTLPKK